jgi:endogenous inhibitor of DNA gyrase (YacG/DUF329 family)
MIKSNGEIPCAHCGEPTSWQTGYQAANGRTCCSRECRSVYNAALWKAEKIDYDDARHDAVTDTN